jgi:hypothetical protein
MRNRPFTEYKSYLDSFKPIAEETNLPKIQIFKDCKLLINSIKSCAYDKTHPQDVAEFPGDDPYDAFRYEVDLADRYFQDASDEFKKIQQQENLTQQLEATNDMTSFYRNARRLENEQLVKPIRRFHNAR